MKIHVSAILFSLFITTVNGFCQNNDRIHQKALMEKIDEAIRLYVSTVELKELGDNKLSEEKIVVFKGLFTPDALIYDGIIPDYIGNSSNNYYNLPLRTVDQYVQIVRKVYPQGIDFVKITKININYDELENNKVEVVAARKLHSKTNAVIKDKGENVYTFTNNDTVLINLIIDKDRNDVKINKIVPVAYNLLCMGCDFDQDAVVDPTDLCPYISGAAKSQGCLPPKTVGSLMIKGGIGASMNSMNALSIPNWKCALLNSEEIIPVNLDLESNKNNYEAFIELGFFLGTKNKFGLSIGGDYQYAEFNARTIPGTFTFSYESLDQNNEEYIRIVTVKTTSETFTSHSITLPFLLNFNKDIAGKWSASFSTGPAFTLKNIMQSKYNAIFNYEAIYEFDKSNAEDDWLITEASVAEIKSNESVEEYFINKKNEGYDVALDYSTSDTYTIIDKYFSNISFVLCLGVYLKLKNNISLITQTRMQYSTYSNKENNYRITDKVGDYNSLLGGIQELQHVTYSLNVGLSYLISKK